MNAPYFSNRPVRRELERERRYPFLALLDLLLGWSIGLATLAISVYAMGRVVLFLFPEFSPWLRAVGL